MDEKVNQLRDDFKLLGCVARGTVDGDDPSVSAAVGRVEKLRNDDAALRAVAAEYVKLLRIDDPSRAKEVRDESLEALKALFNHEIQCVKERKSGRKGRDALNARGITLSALAREGEEWTLVLALHHIVKRFAKIISSSGKLPKDICNQPLATLLLYSLPEILALRERRQWTSNLVLTAICFLTTIAPLTKVAAKGAPPKDARVEKPVTGTNSAFSRLDGLCIRKLIPHRREDMGAGTNDSIKREYSMSAQDKGWVVNGQTQVEERPLSGSKRCLASASKEGHAGLLRSVLLINDSGFYVEVVSGTNSSLTKLLESSNNKPAISMAEHDLGSVLDYYSDRHHPEFRLEEWLDMLHSPLTTIKLIRKEKGATVAEIRWGESGSDVKLDGYLESFLQELWLDRKVHCAEEIARSLGVKAETVDHYAKGLQRLGFPLYKARGRIWFDAKVSWSSLA